MLTNIIKNDDRKYLMTFKKFKPFKYTDQNLDTLMSEIDTYLSLDLLPKESYYIKDKQKYFDFAKKATKLTKDLILNSVEIKDYFSNTTYHHNLKVAELAVATGISLGYNVKTLEELYLVSLFKDIGLVKNNYSSESLTKAKLEYYETGKKVAPLKKHIVDSVELLIKNKFNKDQVLAVAKQYGENIENTNTFFSKKYSELIESCDEYVTKEESGMKTYYIFKSMLGKYNKRTMEKMLYVFKSPNSNYKKIA